MGASKKEIDMVIKIQYDPLDRTLKLIDSELRTLLEGDALYDLAMPLLFETGEEELLATASTSTAHA